LLRKRSALSKVLVVVIVVVIIAAAGAGGLYVLGSPKSSTATSSASLAIIESDPVNQVDSLSPANVTVPHDTTVTLAVQDGDDAPRTVIISAFNVNQTIDSGTTQRITFAVAGPGTFQIYVPARPAENGLKASPSITGYLIVS